MSKRLQDFYDEFGKAVENAPHDLQFSDDIIWPDSSGNPLPRDSEWLPQIGYVEYGGEWYTIDGYFLHVRRFRTEKLAKKYAMDFNYG